MAVSRKIVHVMQEPSQGGAARALVAVTRYLGPDYRHQLLTISASNPDPNAIAMFARHGIEAICTPDITKIRGVLSEADIVHIHWWNNPDLDWLLSCELPAMRLVGWFHIGGHQLPHVVADDILNYFDVAVACSPHTYESPAFMRARTSPSTARVDMAYGPTDFARLTSFGVVPHAGYRIGYIGTVDFVKMHRNYMTMAANVQIPNSTFVVCGNGGGADTLRQEAHKLGMANRLELHGYTDDIASLLSTFDIYGYPLCEDNYSGSELNLQEAMFCGIPPVVFPYGGIRKLVVDNYTGLVVQTEREYSEAITFLCNNRSERERLSRNAKEYARQIFGAEPAARKFAKIYDELMMLPKRARLLPPTRITAVAQAMGLGESGAGEGNVRMTATLVGAENIFITSRSGATIESQIAADEEIRSSSALLREGAFTRYAAHYRNDPWLHLWAGLAYMGANQPHDAQAYFHHAWNLGLQDRRVLWYITEAAAKCNAQP